MKLASLTQAQYRSHENYLDWYIVFEARFPQYWYDHFIDTSFAHVWALRWDGFNWIGVTPYVGYTEILVLPYTRKIDFKKIVKHKRWVYVETIGNISRQRVPWVLSTAYCVDHIKALLGIRNPFIITPKQLWNYLTREQVQKAQGTET